MNPHSPQPSAPSTERLLSLDAFRGATILGMILVNNPGDWSALYWPLAHAPWHGWTPTDLIFPWFLFIVGAAMAFSLPKYTRPGAARGAVYSRVLRRTLVLLALGLLLNASGGLIYALMGQPERLELSTLRWPGVLQRIALVYLAASLLVLWLRPRTLVAISVAILASYAAALWLLPSAGDPAANLSPEGNLVRKIDVATIGVNHMYTRATSEPTDPEGLLSTLPAIVTALLGYWAGWRLRGRDKSARVVLQLVAAGLAVAAAGLLWDWLGMPINKKLWTSSFVLTTGGLGMVALALCYLAFDVWGLRRVGAPLRVVGVNAIFVFVASGLLARCLTVVQVPGPAGERVTLKQQLYESCFTSWIADPKLASLAFATATVAVWWAVLAVMWRRGWVFRV